MNLLRPHLVQAWRNARAIGHIQAEVELIGKALEMTGRGVMALDSSGRIRLATPLARQLITEFFGRFSSRRLPEALDGWRKRQEAFLSMTITSPPEPFEIVRNGRHLVIRMIADGDTRWVLCDCRFIAIHPGSLESLGLTRRESEILARVALGKTNKEIAAALGKSPRTVQKHLERIFAKLDVETRTAAAVVALRTIAET